MSTTPSASLASRVYLDHAATTPVRREVAEQVTADLRGHLGGWANPAAQHASGRRAGAVLAEARARLAAALDVDPHEVLFTSGGTQADALAVAGRVLAARATGTDRPRVVTSSIEHPAVLDSARTAVAHLGAEHVEVGADDAGLVDQADLREAVAEPSTALVSVMTANNETGVVQDMAGLVEAVREASGARRPADPGYVPVHSDAVAALGKVPVRPRDWGLDAMTVTGHKIGAPVGIGALIARRDLTLVAPTGGGRADRGVRQTGGAARTGAGGGRGAAGRPRDASGGRGARGLHGAPVVRGLRHRGAAHGPGHGRRRRVGGLRLPRRGDAAQPRAAGHGPR